MSRFLNEAAEQLRKATSEYEQNFDSRTPGLSRESLAKKRERIAKAFAMLAAIDKGLLPVEITEDVIEAVVSRAAA